MSVASILTPDGYLIFRPPGVPDGLSISSVGQTIATLTWAPAPGALSYNVYAVPTTGGPRVNADSVVGTTAEWTGSLSPGTTYQFFVVAVSSAGQSVSPPLVFTTDPALFAPNPVTSVASSTITPKSFNISFVNSVVDATHSVPNRWEVAYAPADASGNTAQAFTVLPPYTISNLASATTYSNIGVTAINAAGLSTLAALGSSVTTGSAAAPIAPTGITISNVTQTAALAQHAGVANTFQYTSIATPTAGTPVTTPGVLETSINTVTYPIKNLTTDMSYNLVCYGINSVGTGAGSSNVAFRTTIPLPIQPVVTDYTSTFVNSGGGYVVSLAFTAASNTPSGGLNAAYTSQWTSNSQNYSFNGAQARGGTSWTIAGNVGSNSADCLVPGTYTYYIINSNVSGTVSSEGFPVTVPKP